MSSLDAITPLPLDPELLGELVEKLPTGVIEQLTDNRQKQTQALARSEKENRLLRELLRLMRVEKYGPASERLSDQQLELLEQEPGVSEAEIQTRTVVTRRVEMWSQTGMIFHLADAQSPGSYHAPRLLNRRLLHAPAVASSSSAANVDQFSPRTLFPAGRKTRRRESDRRTKAARPRANSFRRRR